MKILLTEDDLTQAGLSGGSVDGSRHTVCGVAVNARDAVRLARLHQPDVAIPDMQPAGAGFGTDVAEQPAAAGDLGDTGVLYVTGEAERVHRGARFGHACLSNPYGLAALNAAVAIVRDTAADCGSSHGMTLLLKVKMNAAHVRTKRSLKTRQPAVAAVRHK